MRLLPHNQITLEQLESYTNRNENCCVVNPCGSGKTFIMAAFIENHSDKSFVIITKQKNAAQYYQKKDILSIVNPNAYDQKNTAERTV